MDGVSLTFSRAVLSIDKDSAAAARGLASTQHFFSFACTPLVFSLSKTRFLGSECSEECSTYYTTVFIYFFNVGICLHYFG